MNKNIIVCLDGTWNTPDKPEADASRETNVRILYELASTDAGQVRYYDEGVGTEWYDKHAGGILGSGLSKNIRQAYAWLAQHCSEGDNVFLFGFSRGAYTARSLAGFIYACGLPSPSTVSEQRVEALFKVYKEGSETDKSQVKRENLTCPIHMLGVWDTVGSLGIPKILMDEKFTDRWVEFHDTKLNPEIRAAYHAVAIDEKRRPYEATLWDGESKADEDQILEQVWFAGVHSDVGGGYPERYHSDVPLKWMLAHATGRRLRLRPDHGYGFASDLSKNIHDSYKPLYGPERARRANVSTDEAPKVHRSVKEKMALRPDYQPLALVDLQGRTTLAPYKLIGDPDD